MVIVCGHRRLAVLDDTERPFIGLAGAWHSGCFLSGRLADPARGSVPRIRPTGLAPGE